MFLRLPLELRRQVYRYAALLHEPFDSYRGLCFSCRQIKEEMDKECTRVLGQQIKIMQERLSTQHGITLNLDDTDGLGARRSLKVTVSGLLSLHRVFRGKKITLEADDLRIPSLFTTRLIEVLSQFHFESVTIAYEKDPWMSRFYTNILEELIFTLEVPGPRAASAHRISIELSPLDEDNAIAWYNMVERSNEDKKIRLNGWKKAEWIRYGERIRVRWEWEKSTTAAIDRAVVLRALQS